MNQHYLNWKSYYKTNLQEMYNIFQYYFKDLYKFDSKSPDKFYKFIYQTQYGFRQR
jgi:hypothetical protein